MSFNLRLKGSTLALLPAATLASALVLGAAQTASAQLDQLINCTSATPPGGICSNGVGSSFPFPLFFAIFPDFAPGTINYASRGSSGGITAFLSCGAGSTTGTPTVPNPTSFAATSAPLTQTQLDSYYSATGCFSQGFGPIVELPITASAFAFVYNITVSLNDGGAAVLGGASGPTGEGPGVDLTVSQYCGVFNGTPADAAVVPALPAEASATIGVRRSDGSGTTFIVSSSLSAICTPLGLWKTAAGINRGFGQVSVPDTDAACATPADVAGTPAVEGSRNNTVCWPSTFLSGSGNVGVATVVNAATNRFGYVEFATAAGLDGPAPGTTFDAVDTDLNPANNPAGTNRIFPNLVFADLQNPTTLAFLAPYSGNVGVAPLAQSDASASTCRTVFNNPNPVDGYPIIGVNYLLFYGDYTPDFRPNGLRSPASARFVNQGGTLRDRYRGLFASGIVESFAGDEGRQRQIELGYAPLSVERQTQAFIAAFQCTQAVTGNPNIGTIPGNGTNTRDVPPQIAP
jgi:ABC-type phosphate transport system substrate-binding protein